MSLTVTKEQMAAILNGREYGHEITKAEEVLAWVSGLVVVFGYSDDNMELRGKLSDEVGCCDGGTFKISAKGVLKDWKDVDHDDEEECEAYFKMKNGACSEIEAQWCKFAEYSWTYATEIPHAVFDVVDGGEKYCRGIVFAVADMGSRATPGDDSIASGGAE